MGSEIQPMIQKWRFVTKYSNFSLPLAAFATFRPERHAFRPVWLPVDLKWNKNKQIEMCVFGNDVLVSLSKQFKVVRDILIFGVPGQTVYYKDYWGKREMSISLRSYVRITLRAREKCLCLNISIPNNKPIWPAANSQVKLQQQMNQLAF